MNKPFKNIQRPHRLMFQVCEARNLVNRTKPTFSTNFDSLDDLLGFINSFKIALISYLDCFNSSGKEKASLNKNKVFESSPEQLAIHELLVKLKDKFVAFCDNNSINRCSTKTQEQPRKYAAPVPMDRIIELEQLIQIVEVYLVDEWQQLIRAVQYEELGADFKDGEICTFYETLYESYHSLLRLCQINERANLAKGNKIIEEANRKMSQSIHLELVQYVAELMRGARESNCDSKQEQVLKLTKYYMKEKMPRGGKMLIIKFGWHLSYFIEEHGRIPKSKNEMHAFYDYDLGEHSNYINPLDSTNKDLYKTFNLYGLKHFRKEHDMSGGRG